MKKYIMEVKIVNLILKQKSKDLYNAEFEIINDENIVGKEQVNGQRASMKQLLNGKEYESYTVGLGSKTVSSVYSVEEQIAQIEKDLTVYNDLHNYNINWLNEIDN